MSTKNGKQISIVIILFTILRLLLTFELIPFPPQISRCISPNPSSSLHMLLSDPIHTLHHLKEGDFMLRFHEALDNTSSVRRKKINSVSFGHIYNVNQRTHDDRTSWSAFRLPPLVLASLRPFLSHFQNDFFLRLLLIAAELGIAFCLFDISRHILPMSHHDVDDEKEEEMRLEKRMDARIVPKWYWVFGLDFPQMTEENDGKETEEEKIDVSSSGDVSSKTKQTATEINKLSKKDDSTYLQTRQSEQPIFSINQIPTLCLMLYYCNPITILASTTAMSLRSLWNLLVLFSFRCSVVIGKQKRYNKSGTDGVIGNVSMATFYLSMACYIELYSAVYLIPITILLIQRRGKREQWHVLLACIGFFFLWSTCLHLLSILLVGGIANWYDVLVKTHGFTHGFESNFTTPNIGMHWYFFMEMFVRFRRYFVVMLNGLPYLFMVPLTIRLYKYPIVLMTSFMSLYSILKPTPTLPDECLILITFLFSPRTLIRMSKASIVSIFALPVPIILMVLDNWLWMESGTGNANYLYFQCLAHSLFMATLTMDFVGASLRRDKALRVTQQTEELNESTNK